MAVDATGTPTSPDSIPKYATSADAPSGKGFNAAMDAIQTALSARVSKPSGIASGEVPVWNGSTWVRSSATNISPTSLGSGTPDATKFLRGDGSWQAVTPAALTVQRTALTANVVTGTAGAVSTVLSLSLGAGTYLLFAVAFATLNGVATCTLKLTDGTNVYAEANVTRGAGEAYSVPLIGEVTLAATTTVSLTAVSTDAGDVIHASALSNGSTQATYLIAVKIV